MEPNAQGVGHHETPMEPIQPSELVAAVERSIGGSTVTAKKLVDRFVESVT
jgi:hypothetical protein